MHKTPPAIDTSVTVQLWTPGGLIVSIPAGFITSDPVRASLDKRTQEGDTHAAITMARHTGLDVTIRRETQTTVRASDLEA
jgi:hypothetical protein